MIYQRLLHRYAASYQGFSKAIWLVTLACFFNAMGQMLPMLVSLYLKHLHYAMNTIGIVVTLYGVGFLIGSYISGKLCDTFPAKSVLSYSMLINSLFFFLLLTAHNLVIFTSLFFCAGVSGSIASPAAIMIINRCAKAENRTRALGLRRVGVNLGMGFAALITGTLSTISYDWIFIFSGTAILLASILLMKSCAFDTTIQIKTDVEINTEKPAAANQTQDLRKYWIIVITYFINVIIFAQISFTYPIYLVEHFHSGSHLFAYIFSVNCFLIVAVEVPLLTFLNRFKQYHLMAWGTLLLGLGFAILPLDHHTDLAFFSCVIWTIGEILFFPTALSMALKMVHQNQGKYVGLYQSTYSLGILVAPAIGMAIYNIDHGNSLWYSCGLVGLVSFVQILWQFKEPVVKPLAYAFIKRKNDRK